MNNPQPMTFLDRSPLEVSRLGLMFILFALLSLFTIPAIGQNVIYVKKGGVGIGTINDPAGLQNALDIARNNGLDDTLKLAAGNYTTGGTQFSYNGIGGDNKNLILSGGWSTDYSTQTADSTLVKLNGSGSSQALSIIGNASGIQFDVYIENLMFTNAESFNADGGALSVNNGSGSQSGNIRLFMDRVLFYDNQATNFNNGGAFYINGYFEATNSAFVLNYGYNGGAIYAADEPKGDQTMSPHLINCTFSRNYNYGQKGNTIWTDVALHVHHCSISGQTNSSTSGNGSTIWGDPGSGITVTNTVFKDNRVNYWGSAVQVYDADLTVSNCLFVDNKAGLVNGYAAIAFYHDNKFSNDRTVIITNCTFVDNASQDVNPLGSCVHFRGDAGDNCQIVNTIIYDNGNLPAYAQSGNATISYSILDGGIGSSGLTNGGHVFDLDPQFASHSSNDFHIKVTSPCVNAGDNNAEAITNSDLDGANRILDGTIDIGVYEYNSPPTALSISSDHLAENQAAGTSIGIFTTMDASSGDDFTYRLIQGNGVTDADNSSFYINGFELYSDFSGDFEAKSSYNILVRSYDSGGQYTDQAFVIQITDVNETPVLFKVVQNQTATVGVSFSLDIPQNTFIDPDVNDTVLYSATLTNNDPLPGWLNFNDVTLEFYGTPTQAEVLDILLIAEDFAGLSASTVFTITVDNSVGISNSDPDALVNVYPNPADDRVRIELPGTLRNASISLLSMDGRTIRTIESIDGRTSTLMDISDIPQGMYVLQILENGIEMSNKKLLIAR